MTPITLPLAELKPGLTGLGKVINPKSTLPALQSLRIERTPDGWVCLTATDLDRFVTLRLEQPAKGEPLAMLVPFDDLLRLTKSCGKDERLQLEPGDAQSALIHFTLGSETGQTKVKSLPVDEFPPIPKIQGHAIPLSDALRQALHEAMACSSRDETRAVLQGAFLDVTKPKAHYVVGTDGRHLSSCNSFNLPLKHPVLIPRHKFLAWREFNLDGAWQMKVSVVTGSKDPPLVQLSSRRWRFITRQIDGPYPNWRHVVPDTRARTTIELDPSQLEALLKTIERLPCHDERYHTLGIQWKDRQMFLLGKQEPTDPWTRVPVKAAKGDGPDITVLVDRELLAKALQFGLNTVALVDELSPLRFSRAGRQMIIMPLRGDAVRPGTAPSPPPTSTPPAAPAPVASPATPPQPAEPTRRPPMPDNESTTIPQPGARIISAADIARGTPRRDPAERPALESALERLETIRAGCREAVAELTRLSDILKQAMRDQRLSQRETQTMRSTLRSLQSLRI